MSGRCLLLSSPRAGSTFLLNLLRRHPQIMLTGEMLSDSRIIEGDPLEDLDKKLSKIKSKSMVGFKLFPEHLQLRGIKFDQLVRHLQITHVIVLWRENLIEQLASLKIAQETGEWFLHPGGDNNKPKPKVTISSEELDDYIKETESDWAQIGATWPVDVIPVFVKYEDLVESPMQEIRKILHRLSLEDADYEYDAYSQRQNPEAPWNKIANWTDLSTDEQLATVDIELIVQKAINQSLQVPTELLQFVPDREPPRPEAGWRYQVSAPYMSDLIKENVAACLNSGSVSSAGFWPKEMIKKLKSLFQVPVAQPCCNGFTSLMLALQAANIGPDDEVIIPSMTMIAVANAVHYVGGTVVFADNADSMYNPGWKEIAAVATSKTKAVIVAHTYGVPVHGLESIAAECKQRDWWLIEDISECVGIQYETSTGDRKYLGTFGDFACASLYANKIIHAGDGGFVLAKDPKHAASLASYVNHGFTPSYHFVHFKRSINAKINGIGASVACGCLDEISKITYHRGQLANWYRQALQSTPLRLMPSCGPQDTPWVFGVECENKTQRTRLRALLADHAVETRDYFFPLHLQPAYRRPDGKVTRLPNAEKMGNRGFYLPTHPNITERDVKYIGLIIQAFFNTEKNSSSVIRIPLLPDIISEPEKVEDRIQFEPDGLRLMVKRRTGNKVTHFYRDHPLCHAVTVGLEAQQYLIKERFDDGASILKSVKEILSDTSDDNLHTISKHLDPYVKYIQSQTTLEPDQERPWLHENLQATVYQPAANVRTTSDPETLQLLVWLIKTYKPKTVFELGCWFGHSTLLMALAAKTDNLPTKFFACDGFKMQDWMLRFMSPEDHPNSSSFLDIFRRNIEPVKDAVFPIRWANMGTTQLPVILTETEPVDMVFIDFTQEAEELETTWLALKSRLIANETLIVFNGLSQTSIPFFSKYSKDLVTMHKPHTIAKVFRYVPAPAVIEQPIPSETVTMLARKVNFLLEPLWEHHHKNAFFQAMSELKAAIHDAKSPVSFIPAVEEYLCNDHEVFLTGKPWMGIVHQVPYHAEQFYHPDLNRLCQPGSKFENRMKNCVGLFTLTKVQESFLRDNLNTGNHKIPIQSITYPYATGNFPLKSENSASGLLHSGEKVDLLFVGSFARDYDTFYDCLVPKNIQKVLLLCDSYSKLLLSQDPSPADVVVRERLNEVEYEHALKESVVFLAVKHDGAAHTIILECVAKNIPILAPAFESCKEYLGDNYPLLYDPNEATKDFRLLLTKDKIDEAVRYLESVDKHKFSVGHFVNAVQQSTVLLSLPPITTPKVTQKFDVTVCICSYKRTHHLLKILTAIWERQDFSGTMQIIVWNNNEWRSRLVHQICEPFIARSNSQRSLELVNSTANYYCSVRFAIASLMKSDNLLICDDDILPENNFIRFFMEARAVHPEDVLCLRGHKFLPHELNYDDPTLVWNDYQKLRFVGDDKPEQYIHFAHADACLIPRQALRECASVSMPDEGFNLVDDYWMSFVLSHKFGRRIRKLCAEAGNNPVERAEDSDTVGLALHTRPEVKDARIRLYIHHMLQGWPTWNEAENLSPTLGSLTAVPAQPTEKMRNTKHKFWMKPFVGYNASSRLSAKDIDDLSIAGVECIRIGAVGVKEETDYDLCGFLTEPYKQLTALVKTIQALKDRKIQVVITLERRLANAATWKLIAEYCGCLENVVGYDLINEPFTATDDESHAADISDVTDPGIENLLFTYKEMITAIKEVDAATPILIEPTFWAHINALSNFPIISLTEIDPSLIVSVHFYEPRKLTYRAQNKRRYGYPGNVPVWDCQHSEVEQWNKGQIRQRLQIAIQWATAHKVRLCVGEFGICRDTVGAREYLEDFMEACREKGIGAFLYGFRDKYWEGMDYELGVKRIAATGPWETNPLMQTILNGIANAKTGILKTGVTTDKGQRVLEKRISNKEIIEAEGNNLLDYYGVKTLD
ncbi:uncharacterized protein LOC129581980 [Paramacrobiotus metropolitanus]|uniref:uncharacterized protein LOC129581980 n=1 Tax=Paramacrobiotus metropolitanus TaxID=2943436 RepID=UPI0024462647|nr:uncharacterized protein LOC129581980 [Paramacrobiotus metropolitanus]